jgi:hypothetical protein
MLTVNVNADKDDYMVMSRDHNAGRIDSIWSDNCSSERVNKSRYLGTNLTNQNSLQEEIHSD